MMDITQRDMISLASGALIAFFGHRLAKRREDSACKRKLCDAERHIAGARLRIIALERDNGDLLARLAQAIDPAAAELRQAIGHMFDIAAGMIGRLAADAPPEDTLQPLRPRLRAAQLALDRHLAPADRASLDALMNGVYSQEAHDSWQTAQQRLHALCDHLASLQQPARSDPLASVRHRV